MTGSSRPTGVATRTTTARSSRSTTTAWWWGGASTTTPASSYGRSDPDRFRVEPGHAEIDLERCHQLRARERAGAALQRRRVQGRPLPRVPSRDGRAHQAQARVGTDRAGGRLRRHREGLRDGTGQVRDAHPGRARLGGSGSVADDRHRGLRRARGDRSALLRQAVLPRAAERRGEVVRPPTGRDGEERTRRDRALRHAHQAVPRRDPRGRQGARVGDAVLRRRDPRSRRPPHPLPHEGGGS